MTLPSFRHLDFARFRPSQRHSKLPSIAALFWVAGYILRMDHSSGPCRYHGHFCRSTRGFWNAYSGRLQRCQQLTTCSAEMAHAGPGKGGAVRSLQPALAGLQV